MGAGDLSTTICSNLEEVFSPTPVLSSVYTNNYRPQRSWSKVMFLHVSVILFTGEGESGHPLWADTPPWQTPSWTDIPPCAEHAAIQSTSVRYVSYWNAILFSLVSVLVLHNVSRSLKDILICLKWHLTFLDDSICKKECSSSHIIYKKHRSILIIKPT